MGQVTITLNGRTYRLECNDGEEDHLQMLSEQVGQHIEKLTGQFGQAGDDRLLLMASLVVADELWEARRQLGELRAKLTQIREDQATADDVAELTQGDLASAIDAAAARIQALSVELSQPDAKDVSD